MGCEGRVGEGVTGGGLCKANPFLCLVPEKVGVGDSCKWGQNQDMTEAGMER